MRTILTALAFLVMLWAVMPAIKRSIYGASAGDDTDVDERDSSA